MRGNYTSIWARAWKLPSACAYVRSRTSAATGLTALDVCFRDRAFSLKLAGRVKRTPEDHCFEPASESQSQHVVSTLGAVSVNQSLLQTRIDHQSARADTLYLLYQHTPGDFSLPRAARALIKKAIASAGLKRRCRKSGEQISKRRLTPARGARDARATHV